MEVTGRVLLSSLALVEPLNLVCKKQLYVTPRGFTGELWFRCPSCVYCHFRDWMLRIDLLHSRKSPNAVGFHFTEQVLRKVDAAGKGTISLNLKKSSLCYQFKLLREVPSR